MVRARVFLLRGCLQVDLSFTPASEFWARGPNFRLLFGGTVEAPHDDLPADELGLLDEALVRLVEREELLRALGAAVAGLLRESAEVHEVGVRVEGRLRSLTAAWS